MSADFTNFDPYAGYANNRTCNCGHDVDCEAKEAAERMRAATCKCGHVGAECFNDRYCAEPMSSDPYARRLENQINELDTKLQNANAELEAMKAALMQRIENQSGWIEIFRDTINDLQADYASDYMSYRARVDACIISEDFDAEQINDLETTIRVLAGMVN